jgi:polysaccharide pyruvyl transferase WcaK-like protein
LKYLLVGYYGFQNIGDDAMLLGLLDELDGKKVTVLYGDHLAWAGHKSRFVPWSLPRLLWETVRTDTVIVGGGTMLRDWGKGRSSQSLKVLGYATLVKLLGKKLSLVNIGQDSTKQPFKVIHNAVLSMADRASIRDNGFDSSALIKGLQQRNMSSKTLAVMLTPKWGIYHDRPAMDAVVLRTVTTAVQAWLDKDPERRVKFISLNGHPVHSDDEISRAGSEIIGDRAKFLPWNPDARSALRGLSTCCGAIGMRYHACVLPFLVGIPLLYIRTKPYCDRFYERISPWSIIEITDSSSLSAYLDCLKTFRYKMDSGEAVAQARKGINI